MFSVAFHAIVPWGVLERQENQPTNQMLKLKYSNKFQCNHFSNFLSNFLSSLLVRKTFNYKIINTMRNHHRCHHHHRSKSHNLHHHHQPISLHHIESKLIINLINYSSFIPPYNSYGIFSNIYPKIKVYLALVILVRSLSSFLESLLQCIRYYKIELVVWSVHGSLKIFWKLVHLFKFLKDVLHIKTLR